MYLLDTNACLDFLLGRSARVAARIGRAFGTLTVSAVTAAELAVGNRTSAQPEQDARALDIFLVGVAVAPFDAEAAVTYGSVVRATTMRRGSFDRLIAAHALALGLTLVTNNERDFADIAGLKVENWAR